MQDNNSPVIDAQRVNPGTLWQRRDGQGNPGKDMVHPGKEARDLLMRTYLPDADMARDVVAFRDYIRQWGIEEDDAIVEDLLCLLPSVKGLSRHQFVEINTGLMDEEHRERGRFRNGGKGSDKDKRDNS